MECEREVGIDLSDATSEEGQRMGLQVARISPKKRMYECTFCKRGFTNAQALGGHMNIHRKDRARAKQNSPTRSRISGLEDSDITPQCDQAKGLYPVWEARTNNYRMFLQPHVSVSPSHRGSLACGFRESDSLLLETRSCSLSLSDREILGSNLSLRIGSSTLMEDYELNRGIVKDPHDELDLELRLGHDP